VSGSEVKGVVGLIVAETVDGEYAYDDGASEYVGEMGYDSVAKGGVV
jgi:hypothetical protein